MNKEQFIKYIENPNALSNESLAELKQILDDFPYFQTAQMLYAKNLHNIQDIKFDSQLKIASAYTNNRERLFYLINNSDFVAPIHENIETEQIQEIEIPEVEIAQNQEIETSVEAIELIEEEIFKIETIEEKIEVEKVELMEETPAIEMQEIVEVEQFINEIAYPSEEVKIETEPKTEKPRSIADEILERVQRLKNIQNQQIKVEEKAKIEPVLESKEEIQAIVETPIIEEIAEPIIEKIEFSLDLVWNIENLVPIQVIKTIEEILIEKIEFDLNLVWNIENLIPIEEIEIIEKIEFGLDLIWNVDSIIPIEKPVEIKVESIKFEEIINVLEFVWNLKPIVVEQIVEHINIVEILEKSQFIVELSEKTTNLTKPKKIVKPRIRFEKIYVEIPLNWIVIEKYIPIEKSKLNLSEIFDSTPLQWEIISAKIVEIEAKKEEIKAIEVETSEFSFNDWLKIVTKKEKINEPIVEKQTVKKKMNMELIDKFIEKDPRISQKIDPNYSLNEIIIQNSFDSEHFMTETLAEIYVKQGHFDKAISVYQKLSLKNSENYIYFAVKIEEVQNLINQQKKL